jgi:hypothetical protein
MAQVTTTVFYEKDAFKAIPALKQSEAKDAALKKMQTVDIKKFLDEDAELEGAVGLPFRFGYGFDVDYGLEDGTWVKQKDKRVLKTIY